MKKLSLVICLASFVAGCGKNNHEIPEAKRIIPKKEQVASKPKNLPTVLKPEPEPAALLAAWEKAGLSKEDVATWEKAGFQSGWMRSQKDSVVSFCDSLNKADASRAVPAFKITGAGPGVTIETWKILPAPKGEFGLYFHQSIKDADLKEVTKFHQLTKLELFWCGGLTVTGLKELAQLQNLSSLNLENTKTKIFQWIKLLKKFPKQ